MIAPLRELQDLVMGLTGQSPSPRPDPFLSRVAGVVNSVHNGRDDVGVADVAGLLRQGILRSHLADDDIPELRVPKGIRWPDSRTWNVFGCDATPAGSDLLVRPRRWEPAWLETSASAVVEAAIREESRRRPRSVPADPRVTERAGFVHYASPGQREAVRAAFLTKRGATLVVNLPTGAGKTLAFQLPALLAASSAGLTLVLVPTVALARDQEERFRALLQTHPQGKAWASVPLAYFGGLAEDSKAAICAGISKGTLPIVFASAEAALGALRGPLFDAARNGRLGIFAIDEAHIVSQWGQQFRPEFQSVAGLRNALLEACPTDARFRTLLLTATLTSESFETLRLFFGSECEVVSEAVLRPEPGFLLHSTLSETEREERVLEAVRHLPRPMIVYTTLREDAEAWALRLREAGFQRVRLVRGGDLATTEGEGLLREWRDRAFDIVVATSAFGLGMDQSEVRSVVHACLPESIDRFYQEVGRAGRDGNAAVALLISTPRDLKTAESLGEDRIISAQRGFERWDAMWTRARRGDADTHVVSLDERPPDIASSGVRNASWNLRTLVLMARAQLIEFAAHPPPQVERGLNEEDATFEHRRAALLDRFYRQVAIRIKDNRASIETHWNRLVAKARAELRDADDRATMLVGELRKLERPLNDLFRDVYSIDIPFIRPPQLAGSCPVTRARGTVTFRSLDPEIITLKDTSAEVSASLRRALSSCTDDARRAWVAYDPATSDAKDARKWRGRLRTLLRFAVSHGIVELCLPDESLDVKEWSQLGTIASAQFLVRNPLEHIPPPPFTPEMPLPRLSLLSPQRASVQTIAQLMRVERPLHVLVLPRDVRDPTRPDRNLFDVIKHMHIDDLIARLES